ncbi:IS3 family transposase [Rhodovulum sp. MB263]|uniref:IS3 family transposase n=1 Tax=Rhodovulum sp. (strain MB263) TaxID=308754 RepID=UPI0012DAF76B|nr:IS3 family transposase [Rhodovulum sp. MB263]
MATMEIVWWSMSDRLKSSLAVDTMRMALQNRRPVPGLVCHSDRGVQYASGSNGPGDRSKAQNAPMESFFGSLKYEPVHRTRFRSRQEAKAAPFEYIAIFYNRRRRHSSIGSRTPEQARIDMAALMAA